MYKNLKNYLNTHKKGALTGFVVALFAVGALLLGQAGYFGNFGGNLTGAMFNARYARQPIQRQPLKVLPNPRKQIPVVGTLSVTNTSKNASLVAEANGDTELLTFDAAASSGPVKISKFIFDLSGYGDFPMADLKEFRLYRNGSQVKAWNQVPLFDLTGSEEIIAAGAINRYKLVGVFSSMPNQLTVALNSGLITDGAKMGLPIQQTLTKPQPVAPSSLTVNRSPGFTTVLISGENDLIGFSLTADNARVWDVAAGLLNMSP